MWMVDIVPPKGTEGLRLQDGSVRELTVVSRLNEGVWIEVELDRSVSFTAPLVPLATEVSLKHDSAEKTQLRINTVLSEGSGFQAVLAARWLARSSADAGFTLYQRKEDETPMAFLQRFAGGRGGKLDYSLWAGDWLQRAAFPGCCLAIPDTLPVEERLACTLGALGERVGAVAGWCDLPFAEKYFPVNDTGEIELSPGEWSASHPGPSHRLGARTTFIERALVEDPNGAAKGIFSEMKKTLAGNDAVPVAPGPVRIGGRKWFATEVATKLDFAGHGASPGIGGRTVLSMVDPSVTAVDARQPRNTTLVGMVHGADGRFMDIVPPEDGHVEFPEWSIDGELRAYHVEPTYARDGECALYVQWKPGDLVLFNVGAAGLPVVLGALGECLPKYEDEEDHGVHFGTKVHFYRTMEVSGA